MVRLRRVTSEDEARVLQFEQENRDYFTQSISDRGDDYFEHFAERHRELLAQQDAGACAFYVLDDDDGRIVGRFNLYDLEDGVAHVGYRVGEQFSGHGVATSGLLELCRIAYEQHALRTLVATTSVANIASQTVLVKAGFVAMETAMVARKEGLRFELSLTAQ